MADDGRTSEKELGREQVPGLDEKGGINGAGAEHYEDGALADPLPDPDAGMSDEERAVLVLLSSSHKTCSVLTDYRTRSSCGSSTSCSFHG
jgi:hypothetical protein